VDGAKDLTLDAKSDGNVTFSAVVGQGARLGAILIDAAQDVTFDADVKAASISHEGGTGSGTTAFGGSLDATDDIVVNVSGDIEGAPAAAITSAGGRVSFITTGPGGTIASLGTITADDYVYLSAPGGIDTVGDINAAGDALSAGNAIYVFSASGDITGLHGLTAENAGNIYVSAMGAGKNLSGTAGSTSVAYGYLYLYAGGDISAMGDIGAQGNATLVGNAVYLNALGGISGLGDVTADNLGGVLLNAQGGTIDTVGNVYAKAGSVALSAKDAIAATGDITSDAGDVTLSVNNGTIGNLGKLTGDTVTLQVLGGTGASLEVTGTVEAEASTQLEVLAGGGATLTLNGATIRNTAGDVAVTAEDETITGTGDTVIESVPGSVYIQSDFTGGGLDVTAGNYIYGREKTSNVYVMLTSSGQVSLNAPNGTVVLFGDISADGGVAVTTKNGYAPNGDVTSAAGDITVLTEGGIRSGRMTAGAGSIRLESTADEVGLGNLTAYESVEVFSAAGIDFNNTDAQLLCGDPVAQTGGKLVLRADGHINLENCALLQNYGTGTVPADNYVEIASAGGNVTNIRTIRTNGAPVTVTAAGLGIGTIETGPAVIDAATGDVTIRDMLALRNNLTVTGGTVRFDDHVVGFPNANTHSLVINAADAAVFSADVGGDPIPGLGTISDLTVDGPLTTGAGCALIKTDNAQTYNGAVTLGADTVLTGTDITFWDPLDSDGTPRALTVNTAGGGVTHFCDNVGYASPFKSITTNGDGRTDISCGGVMVNGNTVTFNDPVQILQDTSITDMAGDITFNDSVYGDAAHRLTLNAAGNVIYGNAIGGDVTLGSVTMTAAGLTVDTKPYVDPATTTLTDNEAKIVNGSAVWWNTFRIWPAGPGPVPPVPAGAAVVSGIDLGWLFGLFNNDVQKALTEPEGLPEPPQPSAPQIRLGLDPWMPTVQYNVMSLPDTISFTLHPPSEVARLAYNIAQYEEILRGTELGREMEPPAVQETVNFGMMDPLLVTMGSFVNLGGEMAATLWWKKKK